MRWTSLRFAGSTTAASRLGAAPGVAWAQPLKVLLMVLTGLAASPRECPGQGAQPLEPAQPSKQVFNSSREIRKLSPAEASQRHPVLIRAVVTAFGRANQKYGYFVMDESGPIFIARDAAAAATGPVMSVGQLLEIEGTTDQGTYAPVVRELRRTHRGQITLPAPPRLTYEQLATGGEDCRYAEITGIVRAATDEQLTLAMGSGRVDVTCLAHSAEDLRRLIDARVRLRGVVSGRFNQKRQWVAVRFNVSSPDGIVVERAAPNDPFAAPTHSLRELLQWELNQVGGHRVKVHGVVTHFQPGEALFIREGDTGLQVRTSEKQTLSPGDVVEVLGFPALGTYSAELEDAIYRQVDREAAPAPVLASHEELLGGVYDASLVSLRGLLLESVRRQSAETLVMQAGDIVFHAQLGFATGERPVLPEAGSLLDLTGICVVAETLIHGARLRPRQFSLLLRSPTDIRIVHAPSWWTAERLWQALAVISVSALGILSWVWLLRRQVRAQTAVLKEQTQREAVLEERTRISQELHDTLDQELTGITLQLNAAVAQLKDDPARPRFELVHRLLRRSQSEVRRAVWDLRRPMLESNGLPGALEDTAAQLRSDSTARFQVRIHGEPRVLPALVEHHLLCIGAEAMTNAFKHAMANRINVDLFYGPGEVRLCVVDDGSGFLADQAPGHATGHFGLIGMQERARKIGGRLLLESSPGKGTRIEIGVRDSVLNSNGHKTAAPHALVPPKAHVSPAIR